MKKTRVIIDIVDVAYLVEDNTTIEEQLEIVNNKFKNANIEVQDNTIIVNL